VILGVDTHLDFHVAVAVDHLGRRLGESSVPTTVKGYERLLRWAEGFGPREVRRGRRYQLLRGLKLTRHLRARGIEVLEVERPKHRRRSSRSNLKKSDPSDAERAARAVLAAEASGVPKSADGRVEMIRTLRAARRSAMKARTQAANQLQGLRLRAPEQLRHRLRRLSTKELVSVAARLRLASQLTLVTCPRPPSSRCVRWPADTRRSLRRSQSWTPTSAGWWRKWPRSWSPWRASVPTTPQRS
jgi:transposase